MSEIDAIIRALDRTARKCLKTIGSKNVTDSENKQLAKFLYGLVQQQRTLPRRVQQRGAGEIWKVLRYLEKAANLLEQVHRRLSRVDAES